MKVAPIAGTATTIKAAESSVLTARLLAERSVSAISASSSPVIAKGAAITGVYPIAIADNQPAASTAGQ